MGETHGGTYAAEIRRYVDDRVGLVASGVWSGGPIDRSDVLDLAGQCVAAHQEFSPSLFAEMEAMAAAAGISLAEAVVVGGFTDFVDTVCATRSNGSAKLHSDGAVDASPEHSFDGETMPIDKTGHLFTGIGNVEIQLHGGGANGETAVDRPQIREAAETDDCTAFLIPDGGAGGSGFLGQTWDMHASATDHVVLARLRPESSPEALVFTTVGCLGQIGMNEAGVCVGINNLTGSDGCFGVTWPLVVREMLACESAAAALRVLLGANLAGAHNYLILDASGVGYNIEAMPSMRRVEALADEPSVHTNHVIDPTVVTLEGERELDSVINSQRRLEVATEMLKDCEGEIDLEDLIAVLREPTAICRRPIGVHGVESSGAVVMRPRRGDFWACWGIPADNDFEYFSMIPALA